MNAKIVLLLIGFLWSGLALSAESVTFGVQELSRSYGQDMVTVPVDKVVVDADAYFSSAEVANLSPFCFQDDVAILFGDKVGSTYPLGVMKLTLSPNFKPDKIISVSVDAELYNEYNGVTNQVVYLYVNGSRSENSIYANSSYINTRATLTCEVDAQCDALEICMASNIKRTTSDSQAWVRSITIEYEGIDPNSTNAIPSISDADPEILQYYNLLGLPVSHPIPGQFLIQSNSRTGNKALILYR